MSAVAVEILPGTVNSIANTSMMKSEPDFSEFLWMAEELDQFDIEVIVELEQEYLEYCLNELAIEEEMVEMMEDPSQEDWFSAADYEQWKLANPHGMAGQLNPEAAEFVPRILPEQASSEPER